MLEWLCGLNALRVLAQVSAAEQIVGRERNQRISYRQLIRSAVASRRVNSTVRRLKQPYSHTTWAARSAAGLDFVRLNLEVAVIDEKSVLVIGLEPTLIDFSGPDFAATGMDATKVLAGLKSSEDELTRLGYSVQMCLTDFGETAEAVLQSQLKQKQFDCIMIGAGIRTIPNYTILFEKIINVVHEHAPQAKLCFNTKPSDTADAVQRWL